MRSLLLLLLVGLSFAWPFLGDQQILKLNAGLMVAPGDKAIGIGFDLTASYG